MVQSRPKAADAHRRSLEVPGVITKRVWRQLASIIPISRNEIAVDPKAEMLAECDCFRTLSRNELEAAARQFDTITVPAGTVLVREGERNETLWLIVEGYVCVSLRGRMLREHSRGELIGVPTMP